MKNVFWIVFALIILFLLFTRQGRGNITRIFQQSRPLNIDFGSGVYQPGSYVIPEFQIPVVNGVAIPPSPTALPIDDKGGCCCSPYPTGNVSRPTVPFVSPSVLPSYTPAPAYVSLDRPSPEIVVYSGDNFDGYSQAFTDNMPGHVWWNDRTRSLEVKGGTWRIYEHANRRGRSAIVARGRYDANALKTRGLYKNLTGFYIERA